MATNQDYNGEWTKDKWCKGPGYIVEGKSASCKQKSDLIFVGNIVHKRVHTVKLAQKEQSPNALPTKFLAFRLELTADPIKRKEIILKLPFTANKC